YNLSANVTDNHIVNVVLFNVSNASNVVVAQLIGTLSSASRYSVTSNTSDNTTPGNYTYRILSNDTSNNLNNTVTSTFVINDVVQPNVTTLLSNPGRGNQSNTYNLTAVASDNHELSVALFNVSNSTHVVVSQLIGLEGPDGFFSVLFNTTSSTSPGNYTFKIIANDTSNNVNNTVNSTFAVVDVTNPTVLGLNATPATGNQTTTYNLTFNVSDNFLLDNVSVNLTLPNASIQVLGTTVNKPGQRSAVFSPTLGHPSGNYTWRVIANDSSGNVNASLSSTFVVNDFFNATWNKSLVTINPTNISLNVTFSLTFNNTGTANITNLTFLDTFNQIFLNFTNASIGVSSFSNLGGNITIDQIISSPLVRGQSVIFNITLKAMKNTTSTTDVANVSARDSNNNSWLLSSSSAVVINKVNATQSGYPNGTNFNEQPDITNISNATLSNDNASIQWNNTINANGAHFDTDTRFGVGTAQVNTTAFDPSINTSAIIQIKNVTCQNPNRVTLFDGFNGSFTQAIMHGAGRDCTLDGICSNITCSANTLTFITSHFTGFAAGANANLTIAATGRIALQSANFTAFYINASNGATILGGSCNLSVSIFNVAMSNISAGYTAERDGIPEGTFGYNVTCAAPGFTTLFATDNISMSASSTGGGGAGGAGLALLSRSTTTEPTPSTVGPRQAAPPAPTRTYTAFDIIDIIKGFYTGTRKHTAFQIIDIIKEFYTKK
ncbi:hypothetical protein HY641_02140, partial [Candidatus Woesearchaeota archaeon]|nr:hypothetical protein [Candidatus Woesearchaeota archaeon]